MSEFKFACPVCGQHMMCDSSQGGSVMDCPTCFQKIIAPQAPASDQKLILTGTQLTDKKIPARHLEPARPEAKKFPIASLVLFGLVLACGAAVLYFRDAIFKGNSGSKTRADRASANSANPATGNSQTGMALNGINNLALNKPAFASSQESQHPVQFGNDGNNQTRWCAANANVPQWWKVDLGTATIITNTQVIWERGGVHQYKIETSPDNVKWTTAVNETTNANAANMSTDHFSASARYVRIVVTGLPRGSWASFFEFQAFGSGG
jgi:F5/8 type C domain